MLIPSGIIFIPPQLCISRANDALSLFFSEAFQPVGMRTTEEQFKDTPREMMVYTDSDGNTCDFTFGLNREGVINDNRVAAYK